MDKSYEDHYYGLLGSLLEAGFSPERIEGDLNIPGDAVDEAIKRNAAKQRHVAEVESQKVEIATLKGENERYKKVWAENGYLRAKLLDIRSEVESLVGADGMGYVEAIDRIIEFVRQALAPDEVKKVEASDG